MSGGGKIARAVSVALGLLTSAHAAAQTPPEEPAIPADVDLADGPPPPSSQSYSAQAYFAFGGEWVRATPQQKMDAVSSEREVAATTLPSTGSLGMLRAQWGLDVVGSRRLLVPLIGVAGSWAVGPSDPAISSADGSLVKLHPWSMVAMSLFLPGIGLRATQRRWTIATDARPAFTYTWMHAQVITGRTVNEIDTGRWSPSVRLELTVCRRLQPLERVCGYLEGRMYEGAVVSDARFLNGGSIGLRWEAGK